MPPSRQWLIISIYPDVCLTSGSPVPYQIVSEPEVAALESSNVVYNGYRAMHIKSKTLACSGDEAGDTGVSSGTVCAPCEFTSGCVSVRVNSFNAIREGDTAAMNNCNTLGRVIIVPAVSAGQREGALSNWEFDVAVCELIRSLLIQTEGNYDLAFQRLINFRNPQPGPGDLRVVNNPVVVAAEHYLFAYLKSKGKLYAGYSIQDKKVVDYGPANLVLGHQEQIDVYYKMKEVFPETWDAMTKNQFGKMNQNQPASEYDPRIRAWAIRGWECSTGQEWGIGGQHLTTGIDAAARVRDMPAKAAETAVNVAETAVGVAEVLEEAYNTVEKIADAVNTARNAARDAAEFLRGFPIPRM